MVENRSRQAYLKALRTDAWENPVTGQNVEKDKSRGARPFRMPITDEDLGLFYEVDDIAQRVVDRVVDDALDGGFDLAPNNTDTYEWFWQEWRRLNLGNAISEAWRWGRLYGDAIILLDIDDGQDPTMPVRMDSIRSIRWAHVLDKNDFDIAHIGKDPSGPYFRKPERFRLYAHDEGPTSMEEKGKSRPVLQEVHASRVIQWWGKLLPWTQYQDNDYFHSSVLQKLWKPASNYDAAHEAIAKCMPELRQTIIKIPGLVEMCAAGPEQLKALEARLYAMDRYRSVHRAVMVDSEEDISTSLLQLGGVENVLRKMAERVVQASEMPHTIALGEGSEGNTSGRSENADWNKHVSSAQTGYLLPRLERLRDLILAQDRAPSTDYDEEGNPLAHEFRFTPLSVPSATEKASTYKAIAEADQIYWNLGVLTAEDIAKSRFTEDGFQDEVYIDEERIAEIGEARDDLSAAQDDAGRIDAAESFMPPREVAVAAQKGLDMRRQFGRGGTQVGIARARDLAGMKEIPITTIGRMVSFFARHEENKNTKTENGEPGNGAIAWLLWGGDPGRRWAEEIWEEYQSKTDSMEVQTLIFSKTRFSRAQVEEWIKANQFEMLKEIDETASTYRVRQVDPERFDPNSFRTIALAPGVRAVVGNEE